MSSSLEPPSPDVRARMKKQRRAGTIPELELRKRLFAKGLRYRVGMAVPQMPRRSIDIAFPKQQIAVFVDGCYWHRCPDHHTPAKNNAAWWHDKLQMNVDRDAETDLHLRGMGWCVMRFWEHQDMALAAELIESKRRTLR